MSMHMIFVVPFLLYFWAKSNTRMSQVLISQLAVIQYSNIDNAD